MTTPSIKTMLFEFMATSEQVWPLYGSSEQLDRSKVLTSSECLNCIRQLAFEKRLGSRAVASPSSAPDWGFAQRGHAVEAWAVDLLGAECFHKGYKLELVGGTQHSFKVGWLAGTPDGLLTIPDGPSAGVYLLEFKSFDPRKNTRNIEANPEAKHYAQVQQNMALVSQQMGITIKGALVLYINASDFTDMYEHYVPYDNGKVAAASIAKAKTLFKTAEIADLPAEGVISRNGDCDRCRWVEDCSAMNSAAGKAKPRTAQPEPTAPVFNGAVSVARREIAATLRRYYQASVTEKTAKAEKEKLGARIREYSETEGQSVIDTAKYIATVTHVAGRNTLDVAAYEEATGVKAADYYKVGKPSLRLEVKEKD